jgi:hypothetical protein
LQDFVANARAGGLNLSNNESWKALENAVSNVSCCYRDYLTLLIASSTRLEGLEDEIREKVQLSVCSACGRIRAIYV